MPRKTRISEKLLLFPDLLLAILSLELSAEIYEQRLILNLQENDSWHGVSISSSVIRWQNSKDCLACLVTSFHYLVSREL